MNTSALQFWLVVGPLLALGVSVLVRAVIRARRNGAQLEAMQQAERDANRTGYYPPSPGSADKIKKETGK